MDDHDITAAVKAANNADMAVTRIKDKVSRLGVTPSNRRTVAVLRSGPAAMPNDVLSTALVVEYPIHHSRTIQSEGPHGASGGASLGCNFHRHSPATVPTDHQRFSSPEIMNFAQELIRRQNYLLAILAEIGGEIFHDLRNFLIAECNILVAAGEPHEEFLILRLHQFLQ